MVSTVVGGIIFNDLDIAHQARASISSFEQVMTQKRILGEAAVKDLMNGVDFVDSFSREATLSVQILIGVRNGAGIDIETGFPGVDGCEPRAGGALHADADPGLQDAISGNHSFCLRIDDGLVQGMRQSSDHAVFSTS